MPKPWPGSLPATSGPPTTTPSPRSAPANWMPRSASPATRSQPIPRRPRPAPRGASRSSWSGRDTATWSCPRLPGTRRRSVPVPSVLAGHHAAQQPVVTELPDRADLGEAGRAQGLDLHAQPPCRRRVVLGLDPPGQPLVIECRQARVGARGLPPGFPRLGRTAGVTLPLRGAAIRALDQGPAEADQPRRGVILAQV